MFGAKLRVLSLALVIAATILPAFAERLSVRNYSSADGLGNDEIARIVPDSRGFLWFCTSDGLSRFDGYRFKNYTQDDGLPHRNINGILEAENGKYYVATTSGLAVFNPFGVAFRWNIITGKPERTSDRPALFETFYPAPDSAKAYDQIVYALARDGTGTVFAGTPSGLYRIVQNGDAIAFVKENISVPDGKNIEFGTLFTDSKGDIWIGAGDRVLRRRMDGSVDQIDMVGARSIFEDRAGRVWIDSGGENIGLRLFENGPVPRKIATFTTKDGLVQNTFTNVIAQIPDGRIFVVSGGKLHQFTPEATPKFTRFENEVVSAAVDQSGNVWFTTFGQGALRYSPNSFSTLSARDGLPDEEISAIYGGHADDVYIAFGRRLITRIEKNRHETVTPNGFSGRSWIPRFLDVRTDSGEWWLPSEKGVYRYPAVREFGDLATVSPRKVFGREDGLTSLLAHSMYKDSHGNVWFSAADSENSLFHYDNQNERLERHSPADGFPANNSAVSYGEDGFGNLWMGFYFGQLGRFKAGKIRTFTNSDGFIESYVSDILRDRDDRLWISTRSKGIFRVDNPNDENPVFTSISTAQGLSTNQVLCLTQDNLGRIYAGTGSGINRIDPATGQIKIYTQADGLPGNVVHQCYRHKDDSLWFASGKTLVTLRPRPDSPPRPPPVFIDGIAVNGTDRSVSELGETAIGELELGSDEGTIEITFFAVSFDSGENLRYQYRFEGQEWSAPTEQRRVNLNLSAGEYRFFVRALNSDGAASEIPAIFTFRIQYPLWQRWWFVGLVILIVGSAIFALDRYRVSKTHQIEIALGQSRESEERFRTLADTASDAILTIDENGSVIFTNQSVQTIFGYSSDEINGRDIGLLLGDESVGEFREGLNRFLEPGNLNRSLEFANLVGIRKNGGEIPLEVSAGRFERDGERFLTCILRDVAERKRAELDLQRAREERLRELERVRTRIATDLHDDIGSSLTQIAVLSEVARGQANMIKAENVATPLERIKSVSRELVAVMSDVVWAINPQKDFLNDLLQRMRRFAADVFTGRGIRFEFHAPGIGEKIRLGANIRREVFAIFKEAVTNSVKYSNCSKAVIELEIDRDWLTLRVEDDGDGFDIDVVLSDQFNPDLGGNGLINIKRRTAELGGDCTISSEVGKGTSILVRIPLHADDFSQLPEQTGRPSNEPG